MANSVASIEKLNGENYGTWCIQVKSLLITLDLWNTIEVACPTDDAGKTAWLNSDRKALATLTLSVKSSELIHIKNSKTAKEAWEVLNSLYNTDSASRKVKLFKKLVRSKFKSGEKFAVQINEFCSTVDELKEIGITLNGDLLTILLLCSLPEEMEGFVIAIESRDNLPTYQSLISKILEEENRQGDKNNGNGETVFAANSRNSNRKNSKFRNNDNNQHGKNNQRTENRKSGNLNSANIKCYRCGKMGHIRSQCKTSDNAKKDPDHACSLFENGTELGMLWILDSGATSHMCRNKEFFNTLTESRQQILLASGESIFAEGVGEIKLQTTTTSLTLRNVWYVPQLHSNFLSINKIIKAGYSVTFAGSKAMMMSKDHQNVLTADLKEEIFIANVKVNNMVQSVNGAIDRDMVMKWHQRFGHMNVQDLSKLTSKDMVKGLNLKVPESLECVTCAVCKISASPYRSYSNIQTTDILELVHMDICGPMGVNSVGGSSYFMTIIDDYSRYITIYFLKRKSEAFEVFENFAAIAEKQTGRQIKVVRSDNGKEFVNSKFREYFAKRGIVHQTTVCYSPQQNGVAERANRTLVEMARCLLVSSGLPQSLWGEATNTATYIRNRAPTRVLGNITPYERWHGRKPSVFHLKTFGCDAISLQKGPKPKGSKFMPKGIKMKFVGYQNTTKGYRLYNTSSRKIVIARDVIFFEDSFEKTLSCESGEPELFCTEILRTTDIVNNQDNEDVESISSTTSLPESTSSDVSMIDLTENANAAVISTESSDIETEREESVVINNKRKRGKLIVPISDRVLRPRKVVENVEMLNSIIENPQTIADALNSESSDEWKDAMQKEYDSLIKNKTWTLVDRPNGKNIIGCKWVFALKRKPNGEVEKYKARLVAHGCSQKYNVDYQETFAPVVRHSVIRLFLSLAAQHKLLVNHIDIVAAYLNGELKDEVYMVQPPLFDNNTNQVCKLKKSLYGLKQAGREWNKKVNDILLKMGFQRCKSDTCVYVKRDGNHVSLIALYVDDMLIACPSELEMKNIIENINKYVEAVDRGPIRFYLGMEIERDGLRGDITIHQTKYCEEILDRWGMADCKPASTPWPCGTTLLKCDKECEDLDTHSYQSLTGALMYLAVISRPDLMHVVSRLCQFNSHPHKEHFLAAKHVLRYLKNKTDSKLTFKANTENLICFTDADWGSDANDRKSYTGYVLFMGGGPIAWESRKQSVVALSSMEAEYIALCQGTKEVCFHRGLLQELGFNESNPTTILCDNQGAQFLVKNPTVQKKSKHIDIRYHYVREKYDQKAVDIKYVTSGENAADIFTKVLGKQRHTDNCKLLRIEM